MPRSKRPVQASSPVENALTRAVYDNLRRLRSQRGWSMDELSARSGVSKAMLHQIEQGKSVPTIAVVWRIAEGLQVPFGELLKQPEEDVDILLSRSSAKYLTNAEGSFTSRALFPFHGSARTAEFYELRVQPGGREQAAAHAEGTIEHLALVQGSFNLTVGDSTHNLTPGDCLVFAADRPHIYHNPSDSQEAHLFLMMTYALPQQIHA